MRTRRFLTFLLIVLPSLALPAVVLAAGGLSDASRQDDQVAAPTGRPSPAPALAIEDHALESRLIQQATVRAAAEREAAERAAARRAALRKATRQRLIRERASRDAARSQSAPVPAQAAAGDDLWAKLRACEAGGRYNANSGNGYYGAYQFSAGTWRNLGYAGLPHEAPPEVQDEAARKLQARSGWGQWPACSRRIGAR